MMRVSDVLNRPGWDYAGDRECWRYRITLRTERGEVESTMYVSALALQTARSPEAAVEFAEAETWAEWIETVGGRTIMDPVHYVRRTGFLPRLGPSETAAFGPPEVLLCTAGRDERLRERVRREVRHPVRPEATAPVTPEETPAILAAIRARDWTRLAELGRAPLPPPGRGHATWHPETMQPNPARLHPLDRIQMGLDAVKRKLDDLAPPVQEDSL